MGKGKKNRGGNQDRQQKAATTQGSHAAAPAASSDHGEGLRPIFVLALKQNLEEQEDYRVGLQDLTPERGRS